MCALLVAGSRQQSSIYVVCFRGFAPRPPVDSLSALECMGPPILWTGSSNSSFPALPAVPSMSQGCGKWSL
eukprot:7232759-Prorocentrum_lima.AAC.1